MTATKSLFDMMERPKFKRPTSAQVKKLLASLQDQPKEIVGLHGDYLLVMSKAEHDNDFAWSVSVKGAGGQPGVFHTIAGDHWCNSAEEARMRAEFWLFTGDYPPSQSETLRVYYHGTVG